MNEESLRKRALHIFVAAITVMGHAPIAHAHALGQRYDLPLPLQYYLAGAAAAVALSFVIVGFLRRTPGELSRITHHNLLSLWPGRALASRLMANVLKAVSVAVFFLLLACGFLGRQQPATNIVPTFVWILWWVGLAYVCALVGNLWAVINPWAAIAEAVTAAARRLWPSAVLARLRAPDWLGVWPAVVLLLAFGWCELIWPARAVPANIAWAILLYSAITWLGMLLFGRDPWLRRGEAFSVLFALLARFAPTEVRVTDPRVCADCSAESCRDGDPCIGCLECYRRAQPAARQWNLRAPGTGLLSLRKVHVSELAFVLVALSLVTFDGFVETETWQRLFDAVYYSPLAVSFTSSRLSTIMPLSTVVVTLCLVMTPILFFLMFAFVTHVSALLVNHGRNPGTNTSREEVNGLDIARLFVLSLVPIALAYHLAHYFTFLLTYGQLAIPLASDPAGLGWDLFGTREYKVDIGIVSARFVWNLAAISIVTGHVVSVWVAHRVAMRSFDNHSVAMRCQYPIAGLMIGYTAIGLWILAQPIVG